MTPDNPCADALAQLYFYLDGQLTIERRTTITVHLDTCRYCLSAFDFETELRQVVARRCQDQVPDHLRQRVLDVLFTESTAPRPDRE